MFRLPFAKYNIYISFEQVQKTCARKPFEQNDLLLLSLGVMTIVCICTTFFKELYCRRPMRFIGMIPGQPLHVLATAHADI